MTETTHHPPTGLWQPHHLRNLHYGPSCIQNHLLSTLPTPNSKAYIITGTSIATKTPLIKTLTDLLTKPHHAGTYSQIRQHAPVSDLDAATAAVQADPDIDVLISVGGGSPIDSAKAVAHRLHEKTGKWIAHIAIPTTLSAAECTALAGTTDANGVKGLVADPHLAPTSIFYDPAFAVHTPKKLWLATGIRALDHATESMYHPSTSEMPCRAMALHAAGSLFTDLPLAASKHPHDEELSTRLFLAAFASLGFAGRNLTQGLGLSHSLGYALGSPYGIPHGETSCLTLGRVVQLKAKGKREDAEQIARMLPVISRGEKGRSGDDVSDAKEVGRRIEKLVEELGLYTSLSERGVEKDQEGLITQRATGGKTEGEMYDAVLGLVKTLY